MSYKNNFFTFNDFLTILGELRHKMSYYKSNKHDMTLQDVQYLRADISILNSQLGDIGADLYLDKISTESTYRLILLERQKEIELDLRGSKDEHGHKWTDIVNRARYQAELDCQEYRKARDSAAATFELASNFYRITVPKVLDALSSQIAIHVRQMDKGEFKPTDKIEYEEDPWSGLSLNAQSGGTDYQLDELDKELSELEK